MRGTPRTTVYPIIFLTLLGAAAACVDDIPVTSPEEVTEEEVTEPAGNRSVVASVTCSASVTRGELSCGEVPVVDEETGLQRIIVGGQGVFVLLVSSNVSYNSTTEIFQADVRIVNGIQGLGSADGITTTGIQIFHHSGPSVTDGTGTVTVNNADGTGAFTGSNQPFFQYDFFLPPGFTTPLPGQTWEWKIVPPVNTFVFEVFVNADVLNPNGFVAMSPGSALMSVGGGTVTVTGTPLDVVALPVAGTVTYTSSDPTIATVDLNTGVVAAVSAGIVDIIGTTGGLEADGITRITIDPPTAGYDIDLHFVSPVSPTEEAAFTNAAARWSGLMAGDLPTEPVNSPFLCGGPRVPNEFVDDLVINVIVAPIDGVGGTLARARPCFVRPGTNLTAFGEMTFDSADLPGLGTQLGDVVLHEMGHVLGVGIFWIPGLASDDTGPLDNCPDTPLNPFFTGPLAITAFDNNGGATYPGNKVPIEDGFGPGTKCVHWEETVLDDELMTGFIEAPGVPLPLSEVTVKSLADLGYPVAASGWDMWTCPSCAPPALGVSPVDVEIGDRQLLNDVVLGPVYSRDEQGRVIEVWPGRRR